MKILTTLIVAAIATLAHAANSIPVHLDPDKETPQIGSLEALSLAVPAEWPSGVSPVEGWQPIYYRGVFEVYLDNNDISKDLTAKPGSLYYLRPEKNAPSLAIATEKDKADIISVNTWFCKMQLETIVLGYIPSSSVDATSIVKSLEQPKVPDTPISSSEKAVTELAGRLEKTGLIGKNRTGASYKLSSNAGKTLAFVETSQLPDRIRVDEFLSFQVRVSGILRQGETGSDVIIDATSIKKAN